MFLIFVVTCEMFFFVIERKSRKGRQRRQRRQREGKKQKCEWLRTATDADTIPTKYGILRNAPWNASGNACPGKLLKVFRFYNLFQVFWSLSNCNKNFDIYFQHTTYPINLLVATSPINSSYHPISAWAAASASIKNHACQHVAKSAPALFSLLFIEELRLVCGSELG